MNIRKSLYKRELLGGGGGLIGHQSVLISSTTYNTSLCSFLEP